jgi:Protein of unknown function (DUF2934)
MISSKVQKQSGPEIAVSSRKSPGNVTMMPDAVRSQDLIRERAYELYESRGRAPGQEQEDWLRAEREILKQES